MFFSPNCSSSCLQNLRITQKIRKNNQSNSAWMFSLSVCWWSWIGFGTCVMFWIWKKWCIVCSSGKAICFSAFLTIYYPPYPYLGLGSTFPFLPFLLKQRSEYEVQCAMVKIMIWQRCLLRTAFQKNLWHPATLIILNLLSL